MRVPRRLTFLLALLVGAAPAQAQKASRSVAVTFDDLPVMSQTVTSTHWQRAVTRRLLSALARQHVPATGFVTESRLYAGDVLDTGRVSLLRRWATAGHALGNHTWSHLDLHASSVDAFMRDVARGDSVTRRVLAPLHRKPRWFRHPYLHTGRTIAVRDEVRERLAQRGYRIAPVTVDGYDYYFAAAYEAALVQSDSAGAARIVDGYVDHMERVFAYWEGQSRTLLGREIPQVLLLHANVLNAAAFDRLARMLRARGYAFVPLAKAVADPAYALPDTYVGENGVGWIRRWALTRGLPPETFWGEPQVPRSIREAVDAPRP